MANTFYIKVLDKYYSKIEQEENYIKKMTLINNFYRFIKLNFEIPEALYRGYIDNIFLSDSTLLNTDIIQYNPRFKLLDEKNVFSNGNIVVRINVNSFSSVDELLDYIVLLARNAIFYDSRYDHNLSENANFKDINLTNKCFYASKIVSGLLDSLGIKNEIVAIFPGFEREICIENYLKSHYFCFAYIGDKKYIIDCSYSQFFQTATNMLESLGVKCFHLPLPGVYMLQNKSRLDTARTILENGWIQATEENIKNYCDGFALSFRNALYYQNLGHINYETEYSAFDYELFFNGDDSQLHREGKKTLGYQQLMLTKKNMCFSWNTVLYEDKNHKLVKRLY